MKFYFKLFASLGPPFGLCMGVFFGILHGPLAGLIGGLACAVFYGAIMSLVLGSLHRAAVRRLPGGQDSPKALGTEHVRRLMVEIPYDQAFDLCLASASALRNAKIDEQDRQRGQLTLKTGSSWRSFGERIDLEVTSVATDRCLVRVCSRPAVGTTMLDFGKNLDNVERLIRFLEYRLQPALPSPQTTAPPARMLPHPHGPGRRQPEERDEHGYDAIVDRRAATSRG